MIFSAQVPLSSLILLCRVLRHSLGAGLTLREVFRQQTVRGSRPVRPAAERISARLDQGDSLKSALKREEDVFPPLFLALAGLGEETGHLPEIFGELEKYYTLQQRLRRQFRSQTMMPLIQFFLAIVVITGLLFVLGTINASRGTTVGGASLTGPGAAFRFLASVVGVLAALGITYLVLTRSLRRKARFDAFLLRVPALGPCLEALALGRFALALQLTLDTGMPISKALSLSLKASGNAAFEAQTDTVTDALRAGEDVTAALSRAQIFPTDFVHLVAVGEEGGRLPEIMRHQAEHYHEEAERRLKVLTRMAALAVWLIYAAFMIVAIFRLASVYVGALGG